jgi:hypothetical protein
MFFHLLFSGLSSGFRPFPFNFRSYWFVSVTRIFRFRFPNPHFPNRIRFPLTNIEMEIEMEFFRTFPSVFIARAGRPADGSAWRKERQDTMMRRIDAVADQSRAAASFFAAAAAAAAASGWAAGGQPRSWHSSAWPRSTCTGRRLSVSSLAPKADRRGGPGRRTWFFRVSHSPQLEPKVR